LNIALVCDGKVIAALSVKLEKFNDTFFRSLAKKTAIFRYLHEVTAEPQFSPPVATKLFVATSGEKAVPPVDRG